MASGTGGRWRRPRSAAAAVAAAPLLGASILLLPTSVAATAGAAAVAAFASRPSSSLSSSAAFFAFGGRSSFPPPLGAESSRRSTTSSYPRTSSSSSSSSALRSTTPFDASLYNDEDDDENPYALSSDPRGQSPLLQPPGTPILLGINKYSHDVSVCASHLHTGEVLFGMSKERLTRKKHDGGNVAGLVEKCLESLGLDVDDVKRVVTNNHHHRVLGIAGGGIWGTEADVNHMEWEEGLGINGGGGGEGGYTDEENLLRGAERSELSHHLAHAYSAAAQCPFDAGLIVVMDGMGETYRTMRAAILNGDSTYASDLDFEGSYQCIPSDIQRRAAESVWDWREGESVYTFAKSSSSLTSSGSISIKPVFKRFVEERSPPALYNHGFENMDSAGAIYSRASSHVFGDWNACGKVMGLAPWMGHVWEEEDRKKKLEAERMERPIMWGHLYVDDAAEEGEKEPFGTDVSSMKGLPFASRADPDLFDDDGNMRGKYDFDDCDGDDFVPPPPPPAPPSDDGSGGKKTEVIDATIVKETVRLPPRVALDAISLSYRVQTDLESVVLDFVEHFKAETGETNLCIAGGVGLNSVLNGKLSRELGFEKVYIPPYPGDDGIAVGCCAYGLWGNAAKSSTKDEDVEEEEEDKEKASASRPAPPLWSRPLSPYLGPHPTDADIDSALRDAAPWLIIESVPSQSRRHSLIADELSNSGVVALYRGRSELGPRALGHRSILADPRKKGLVRFINEKVKSRESFRPFAPSALAEYADEWFDLGGMDSPYMSLTAQVREEKVGSIPAVTHVDGSSRLQTVTAESEPAYHALIKAFYELTGVPLVLNTSFNTLPGEPIVETPRDAIRSFLYSMGSIEMLVMGDYVIRRKDADVRSLLGKVKRDGTMVSAPLRPVRAGPFEMESKTTVGDDPDDVTSTTRVRMPARSMHDPRPKTGGGWFELLDDLEVQVLAMCDGQNDVQDMLSEYIDDPDEDEAGATVGETETQDEQYQANVFSNIMRRLTRLYEYGFISW